MLALLNLAVFCISLGLIQHSVQAQTLDEARTYQDYLDDVTSERNFIIGSGLLSTTEIMQEQLLEFSTVDRKEGRLAVRYHHMSQGEFECRMYGYLDYCNHPFVEHGGSPEGHDAMPPFNLDFLIVNEFITEKPGKSADVRHFPFFVSGIVPIFKVLGVKELVLTKPVLARIFRGCQETTPGCLSGSITRWDHPDILETNPEWTHPLLTAAGDIKIIVRTENTGATEIMRRALSKFDADFETQVGRGNGKNWTAVDIYRTEASPEGLIDGVDLTEGSISYVAVNLLQDSDIGVVNLLDNGVITNADSEGLSAAVDDFGLAFGNDGRPEYENTVDLTNSLSSRAWPIAYFSYIVVRTNRTDEMCLNKTRTLLDALEYFYNLEATGNDLGALERGVAPIPKLYGLQILDRVRHQLRCNGELAYEFPPDPAHVVIYTQQITRGSMEIMARMFERQVGPANVQVDVLPLVSYRDIVTKFHETETGYIVLADENLSSNLLEEDKVAKEVNLLAFPYAITSGKFIFNFCDPNEGDACTKNDEMDGLTLDIETAVAILDGKITWWNDTRIQDMNQNFTLPQERINLFRGPTNSDFHFEFVQVIRTNYVVDFAFEGAAVVHQSWEEVLRSVSVRPYSFAYVPQNGSITSRTMIARVISRQGVAVKNIIGTLEACARDTYDPGLNMFELSVSKEPDCYPLVDLALLVTRSNYKTVTETSRRVAIYTARLIQFIIRKSQRTSSITMTANAVSGFGTLGDFSDGVNNVSEINEMQLESISLDGVSILIIPHNMNLIPRELVILNYTAATVFITIFVALGIWVMKHRNRKLIRNSSPAFMMQVLFGATLMVLTVIPMTMQDDFRKQQGVPLEDLNPDQPALNAACVAQPIIFSFGFFITFSALFLKSWRLIRIFNNKKLRNLFLRDKQLMIYQSVVLFIVLCLNLVWALQSPMVWDRSPIHIDNEFGVVVESSGVCYSREGIYPAIPLAAGLLLVLLLGNYLAYVGRRIPTEFNESKWVAMSMAMSMEGLIIGVPVLIISNELPVAGFIVKSCFCFLVAGGTVALIFAPKVAMAYGIGLIEGESNPWRFVKPGSSGSNSKPKEGDQQVQSKVESTFQSSNTKKGGLITPSLNSLVSGKVLVSMVESTTLGKKAKDVSTSVANLKQVLDSDPTRRRFRRYLQTLKMDENIKFWDCVTVFRSETNLDRRAASGRAIIQTFVLDSAPFQVNLSSNTKEEIVALYQKNERSVLSSEHLFDKAMDELFQDLRQSDAFRLFLEKDTFSNTDLNNSKSSDPLAVLNNSNVNGPAFY